MDDEQRLVNSLRMQNEVLVADNEEKESTIQAKQAVIDMLRDRLFPVRPVIIPEEDWWKMNWRKKIDEERRDGEICWSIGIIRRVYSIYD